LPEAETIAGKIQQHDDFSTLVKNYQDKVYNTILGMVQNVADAEDLAQEVFIKVFEKQSEFRGDASIGTWIYRVAVTHSIDFLRAKKRKKRAGTIFSFFGKEAAVDQYAVFDHPGVLVEQKENAALLFRAINALPENQRAAFILQKTEGLSQQEIAAIMKLSPGAVESLLSRAKQQLKKTLTEFFSDEK
jgi:RNA polymerase sigma factor (sigma-70 family)